MKDLYDKFAYDYDEFGSIEEYLGNEKLFLDTVFNQYQVKNVLDCACGTGQHLLMLLQLGYQAVGSDFSKSMIEVAERNLSKLGYDPELRQCDFRYLEKVFNVEYDAVLCLTNSLPHVHTDEDLIIALKSMRKRIREGGILILSSGTTHATLQLPAIEVVVNKKEFSRVFVKEHDERFQTIHVLDLFHKENRIDSNQYDIVYRLLLDNDYRRLLLESGYGKISIYGDYDQNPYNKESMRLIVVAEA